MKNNLTIVEILLLIATIIIAVIIVIAIKSDNSKVPSCETYRNFPMKDVPARCLQHFEQNQ